MPPNPENQIKVAAWDQASPLIFVELSQRERQGRNEQQFNYTFKRDMSHMMYHIQMGNYSFESASFPTPITMCSQGADCRTAALRVPTSQTAYFCPIRKRSRWLLSDKEAATEEVKESGQFWDKHKLRNLRRSKAVCSSDVNQKWGLAQASNIDAAIQTYCTIHAMKVLHCMIKTANAIAAPAKQFSEYNSVYKIL